MDKVLHKIANLISGEANRFIIGISGHGASGKTTFAHNLLKLLQQDDVNYINTDPYIVESSLRKYTSIDYEYKNVHYHDKVTACHPAAHHIFALERDIHMLRLVGFLHNWHRLYKKYVHIFTKQGEYCRRHECCLY